MVNWWKYVNFMPICFHSPKYLSVTMATILQFYTHQVLQERLCGLTAALENTSVEKSQQQKLVTRMTKDLQEAQDFISVSPSAVQ